MLKFHFFLFLFNVYNIFSLKNPPEQFKELDNPYRDDLQYTTEKHHHIITAVSSKGYIDYYKGIYYKKHLYCHWRKDSYGLYPVEANEPIPNYLNLGNINDTNLKELHKYGCTYKNLNILVHYRRSDDNTLISLSLRLTNIMEEEIMFKFGFCSVYEDYYQETCNDIIEFDTYNITNNSFLIYTFKFDKNHYYLQSDNFEKTYDYSFDFTNHLRFFIIPCEEEQKLYINSYILSVDLFRYILSLGSDAHNYCTNKGCLNSYSCAIQDSNNKLSPFYYACKNNHDRFYSECSLFGCIPGSFCNPEQVCLECDYQCKTCFNKAHMNCKSCYSLAIYPYWKYDNQFDNGVQCIFEFYPINKAESYNIDVPIPLSYRISFEFWIFIHDPKDLINMKLRPSLSSLILKDFFVVSIHQNPNDYNSTIFILTPFEIFFPFKKDYISADDFYKNYTKDYPSLQYLQVEVYNITSKWFYVKGGLSYTHKKIFINEEEKDLNYIPIYDNDEITNYKFMMRKFYRRYEKTYLRIQGFEYINTDVYIRNLNFYSDYMFNKINSPNYFNMHEITNIYIYPQLILSIPFTNITIDPKKMYVHYEIYDFSGQYTDIKKEPDKVIKNEINMKLVRDYLAPSKNFYRLNFLKFKNYEFSTTDLSNQELKIECSDSDQEYCFEDLQPYICKNGYNLMVNYENMTESSCVTNCTVIDEEENEHKYMRLPNIKIKQSENKLIQNNICSYECNPSINENCPTNIDSDIKDFKCKETYYSYFYQCLNDNKYPSKKSALQFSGTLNTKSIYFPIGQDLHNFYIEMWFHTDLLTTEEPPLYTKYIFMTNNQHIYYDISKQQFVLKVYSDNTISIFNLMQKIYYYGWNHLILYSKEELTKGQIYTTFSVSLANNLIEIGTIQGRSTANKICFCNTDNNCCDRVSKAIWFDLFIREIKVWNAKYVNYYTINTINDFN